LSNEGDCDSWGNNNSLFRADDDFHIKDKVATFYAAQLLTRQWTNAPDQPHKLYATSANRDLLSAFAARRPDGRWALLLINKDPQRTVDVKVGFTGGSPTKTTGLSGSADLYQLSSAEYEWVANGDAGHTKRSTPPSHSTQRACLDCSFTLPPYSLSVLVGTGPAG
jgi:hypothetical protein